MTQPNSSSGKSSWSARTRAIRVPRNCFYTGQRLGAVLEWLNAVRLMNQVDRNRLGFMAAQNRYDLLIAGHARSRGLVVVTGNPGEFSRVEGLRCEDWLGSQA